MLIEALPVFSLILFCSVKNAHSTHSYWVSVGKSGTVPDADESVVKKTDQFFIVLELIL